VTFWFFSVIWIPHGLLFHLINGKFFLRDYFCNFFNASRGYSRDFAVSFVCYVLDFLELLVKDLVNILCFYLLCLLAYINPFSK